MSTANGRTLYRIPSSGKISGVCAGIADFFNLETWLVRVVVVSIFLLGGSGPVFIIYVALWMILDIKPEDTTHAKGHKDIEVKKKVWQAGEPAKRALHDVNSQFYALEIRLQRLERHVTSDNFDLKREINNL
ncbi:MULTISPECIES: envelope stress response membrane protein PspC [unclassified Shewanella]|uniref:envelope stress response membrane protein PspC n=1 Tax=unclassified Shewanella TaxID=196818 RepID=UPI0009711800|nr:MULTISPECIES: envelope stress response membrane protein PspC [unclassified Shewanella]MDO6617845.1 envelope stress response membrane protein PspC [Shewanella sp. 6_MG-2023]MDO6639275.1 envelope stress response membrane protein PspC [Shewanella sp. 5_MG-2023]MDO6677527.1 envelope stress response membrane protein PspC [Shewanella sp. 4_MG-2023]PMG41300.1 phage shock protein C [Shewanella sp. 10N.286.52.B9]PMH84481.1 phage shock protein C [Shewanella sp. 10N.286.48.B5]